MKFVIEHLEDRMYKWCRLEYAHIARIVGRRNLVFTNVSSPKSFAPGSEVCTQSVKRISKRFGRTCLLDPSARKRLSAADAKKFDAFVFGGILGDHPMKFRTKEFLPSKYFTDIRNLGNFQFSTDTAVYVTKKVLDGMPWKSFKFQDEVELPMGKGVSMILPFRYVLEGNKPMLPSGLVSYLKSRKSF